MTTIELYTRDQELIATEKPVVSSGDRNSVQLKVNFDSMWNGYAKTAVFYKEANPVAWEMLLTDGKCTIPSEVTAKSGHIFIGVRGVSNGKVKTSALIKYKIVKGAGGNYFYEPTDTIYQQILTAYELQKSRLDNLAKLEEGSTTGDAELLDMRVGADGKSYETAGEAVRTQFGDVRTQFENLENDLNTANQAISPLYKIMCESSVNVKAITDNTYRNYIPFTFIKGKTYRIIFNLKTITPYEWATSGMRLRTTKDKSTSYICDDISGEYDIEHTVSGQYEWYFTATSSDALYLYVYLQGEVGSDIEYDVSISTVEETQSDENIDKLTSTIYLKYTVGGIYASSGDYDTPTDTTCHRARTVSPVYMRKGDVIVSKDDELEFIVFKYNNTKDMGNVVSGYYVGMVNATSGSWHSTLKIVENGYYSIVIRYSDDRTFTLDSSDNYDETALKFSENVVLERNIINGAALGNKEINDLPLSYTIPFASVSALYSGDNKGIIHNVFLGRCATIALTLNGTVKVTCGKNYQFKLYSMENEFFSTSSTDWGNSAIAAKGIYKLLCKKADDSNFTYEEIEDMCGTFTFEHLGETESTSIVSVKQFGAMGDGLTDDTTAIQSALNSCENSGGLIYFPAGTYIITNGMYCYSNTTLLFDKGARLLRNASINNILRTYSNTSTLAYDGCHDITVIGATFDNNTGIDQGCAMFAMRHAKNIKLIDCTFLHQTSGAHCIECNSSKNVIIENCTFDEIITTSEYGESIQLDGAIKRVSAYPWDCAADDDMCNDNTGCENIEIKGCVFNMNTISPSIGNHGTTELYDPITHKNINIHDNTFKDATNSRGTVIMTIQAELVKVHNNTFENCTKGVVVEGCDGFTVVEGNIFCNVSEACSGVSNVGINYEVN